MGDDEDRGERLDRELIELLNELRVALPGVQVLFGFLLTVPFSQGWQRVTETERRVFFVTFICTAIATALLIAPSAQHRILWRAHDKEALLRRANALALAGTVFLAGAVTCAVWVVTDVIYKQTLTAVATAGIAGLLAWIWFASPLIRRARV
jgi:Flp pilus assembly protein TadB